LKLSTRNLLFLLAIALSWPVGASKLPILAETSLPSAAGFDITEPDFLPVEEAYQLLPSLDGGKLRLHWTIADGYYLYQNQFKVTELDSENRVLPLVFEPGTEKYDDYYEQNLVVYYNRTTVTSELNESRLQKDGTIGLEVVSQACADAGLCYPPRSLYLDIDNNSGTVSLLAQPPVSANTAQPQNNQPGLAVAIAFALLGGLLLNLMPCVFPVLSIKVLSLTSSHLTSHRRHLHGLSYGAGVVATFAAVAVTLIVLRQGGKALGWGFQLQSPGFITALVFLFFLMGLSFSGFFQAGSRLMSFGQQASTGSGLQHSFLTGVLATLVASPCSAPFMGTALGYALTQPAPTAMLIFVALGLGMALPFLILAWSPTLMKYLPKPGPWMNTLKEFLAFPLYLTCLWLLWILGNQTDGNTVVSVLTGLVFLTFAIWLGARSNAVGKGLALAIAIGAVLLPANYLSGNDEDRLWHPYSEAKLEGLLQDNRAVFVNLTADWCITCLANEKFVLDTEAFGDMLEENDIVYLKGDWTNYDPEITHLLNRNGRNGVPLYLFYRKGVAKPQILPQILSMATIRKSFAQN
jgi:thiol:disulfide interchange protein